MQNGHVTEVVSLMQAQWSCYRGGHFNGWRMVVMEVANKRENVTDVSLMDSMVMLLGWPV